MSLWRRRRPVSLVNGRIAAEGGVASSIRFTSRILAVDDPPVAGDVVLDLDGAVVLPGLINAHDHLELNHYGCVADGTPYPNAIAWIDDMRLRLHADPVLRAGRRHPLESRLFIGALKNLLSGVTTVAHHNPLYRGLARQVPIGVVRRYGWAHSFALEREPVGANGEPGGSVQRRYRETPRRFPFVLHAAEGTDAVAAAELARLEALGCLQANTVIVHGVACTVDDWRRIRAQRAGLVWCPASNLRLFGRTIPARRFLDDAVGACDHLALGTDSRLTGSRDLLDELRAAAAAEPMTAAELFRMVTTTPARLFGVRDVGRLARGARADLVILPPLDADPPNALLRAARRDLTLVVRGGRPLVAERSWRPLFSALGIDANGLIVDGAARLADRRLAGAIARCPIGERGVQCPC